MFAMFTTAVTARKVAPNWTYSRTQSRPSLYAHVHKVPYESRASSLSHSFVSRSDLLLALILSPQSTSQR